MNIYNTLTKQKEKFIPLEENKVKMYVCGVTVYDFIHIGNARPYIVFDTIRRYLEYKGYEVTYVQNFTDIDDKIINRANEENITPKQLSDKYIKEAIKDCQMLNIKKATFNPRVTEEIQEIIQMIQILIKKGYAYESLGTVFFNTALFKDYGKLSSKKLEELEIGTRVKFDETKLNKTDFVLWKPKKENEIAFLSPWGEGRPGWHIECSAMAKKYLGEQIDIHAGGEDLIFPHHENEIAQSECANSKKFANYWLHNGFINIDNEKMSKSKGNFFTIRDIAKEVPYDTIRFFLLTTHYRHSINFSLDLLQSAKTSLSRIKNCVKNLDYIIKNTTGSLKQEESVILQKADIYKTKFENAMEDDFNTADAISYIFELVTFINSNVNENSSNQFAKNMLQILLTLTDILGILYKAENIDTENIDIEKIEQLIKAREQARKNKDYKKADEIREELKNIGILIEDTRAGVRWSKIDG